MTRQKCPPHHIVYEEPDGSKSRGRCKKCGLFMPSLPNSPVPYVNPFRVTAKNRAAAIRQWPQRKKKDARSA